MPLNNKEITGKAASDIYASGMFWLERQDYEAAMEALVACHRADYRRKDIEQLIWDRLYLFHEKSFKDKYTKNVEILNEYPYIYKRDYPDFDELNYRFVPYSDDRFIIYDRSKRTFISDFDLRLKQDTSACQENGLILIKNEFNLRNMLACEEKTRDTRPFLWMRIPLYLFYQDFSEFVQYLQLFNYEPALELERLVFVFGREELEQYFSDSQALLPQFIMNVKDKSNDDVLHYICEQYTRINEETIALKDSVENYYATLSRQDLLVSIKGGKPRILFSTSRFTTALQYYIRDCALACDQLGIPNQVLIEKSNLHRVSAHTWLKVLNDFKPDIIFTLDHFRWEMPFLPDNIVHISWVMDVLPNIASQESASKVGPLDFVLNAFVSNINLLLDFAYPPEAIIEAPVVANPYLYRSYSLDQEEKDRYGADICAFSNSGNPQKGLDYLLTLISHSPIYNDLKKIVKLAYRDMYETFYREEIFYSLEDYRSFLFEHMKVYGLSIPVENLDILAQNWKQEIGYRILRSIPLEWLHEKGYALKIWGSEWVDHPVLSSYAQGVAQNGEVLSKIINASKIILGTNHNVTCHPRVFESILSNSFYLGCNVPEEHDWVNIRRYLQEDQEIILAYGREDLYRKVDYYLENKAERQKIIDRARKKTLKYLTYEALISRVLIEIALKLEKPWNGA